MQTLLRTLLACGALGGCTTTVDAPLDGVPATGGSSPQGGSASGGTTSAGGGPQVAALVATPRVARLSRLQWERSVREVLRLSDISAITDIVTGDALVGLDNEAEALRVGPQLRADYEKAARALADLVTMDPSALARIEPTAAPTEPTARAKALIADLGLRAYRRPLSEAEVASYAELVAQAPTLYPGEDAYIAGARLLIATILQSPHFLYRTELTTQADPQGRVPLSDYEVAAKLALSLTASPPDQELLTAAAEGKLRTAGTVLSQAQRLMASPAGALARDHLHFQLYRLGAYDGIVRSATFPDFTVRTPAAMRAEVLSFLGYLFDQKAGIAGIFTTPVSFLNDDLAPLYGLPKQYGATPVRVELDPTRRSGLLTLPGFLSSYAVVDDPDTIHRGVFVNQRVLCRPLPPPDPKATTLVPLDPTMTNRERVEATTGPGTCGAGCHSTVINPPGFAFEHYDAIGRYRTEDRGKPINAAATYDFKEGPQSFDGAIEFSALLAKSPQAHSCYIQGWMSYLNGHPPASEEQPLIEQLTRASLDGALPLPSLVEALVTTDGYLNRLP